MIAHPLPPIYDASSRVLILGSFPSVQSREKAFYYAHPQNRFWRVLSAVFGEKTPETIEEKRAFLLSHHVALWDVIARCEIEKSADSTIKSVSPNDISGILNTADIQKIFVNGKTAARYFDRYIQKAVRVSAVCLPSTSPANARWSVKDLTDEWRVIKEYTIIK